VVLRQVLHGSFNFTDILRNAYMAEIFEVVKIIAIFQVVIIILLLLLAYGVKMYTYYQSAYYQRIYNRLEQLLLDWMEHPTSFNIKSILSYKRYFELLITLINKFDESKNNNKWEHVRGKLMDKVVMPCAEVLARSKAWDKRYIACLAFQLNRKNINKGLLISLINDPIPLISMNAAIIAIKINSQTLMDAVIDKFSDSRRLQQSLYTQVISTAEPTVIPLIENRLLREPNPYIKAFCYRTLAGLPYPSNKLETLETDFEVDNLDLKLTILTYLAHIHPKTAIPFLAEKLHHTRWEIRARAAKLLGDIGNGPSAELLEESLKDPTWWVRINAAEALAKLGKKGINILKKQCPDIDLFAYDVATKVLSAQADLESGNE
jgi:hypothetical protein